MKYGERKIDFYCNKEKTILQLKYSDGYSQWFFVSRKDEQEFKNNIIILNNK